jgi:Fe2+ transport system protein B
MPEDLKQILELAGSPEAQSPAEPTVSTSARISRVCGALALGSVIFFWVMMGLFWLAEKAGGNTENLFEILVVCECCLLPCLSIAAAITAITGLVGAQRYSGSRKVVVWAIVLTLLAAAGFIIPILVIVSRTSIHF